MVKRTKTKIAIYGLIFIISSALLTYLALIASHFFDTSLKEHLHSYLSSNEGVVITRSYIGLMIGTILLTFRNRLKRQKTSISMNKLALTLWILVIILPMAVLVKINLTETQAAWNPTFDNWLKRQQLKVINSSAVSLHANTPIAINLDTKTLVEQRMLKADCSDLRVAYQPDDANYTEITRFLVYPGNTSCATSTATKIYFSLQTELATAASSVYYYVYYNNPTASAPSSVDNAFDIGAKDALLVCPFNGTTTCAAGEVPGTESGLIRFSGSKSALSFDGNSDYVTADNVGTGIQTIEFWVYPFATTNYLIDLNGTTNIDISGGTVRANNFTGATIYVNGVATPSITANTWSHVAITATTAVNASAVVIGKIASTYLNGMIDELKISSVIRYTSAFTPATAPYVRDEYTKLLYHFDENGDDPRQTTKAMDDSGNGLHGTITGAKYVAGLTGVDSSTTTTGRKYSQEYAGHEGVFVEEGTTNLIANPSFENATYNDGWNFSGADNFNYDNTTAPYYKFGNHSIRFGVSGTDNIDLTTTVNATAVTHTLSAYLYRATVNHIGESIDNSMAQLIFANNVQESTSYTDMGGGWWKISFTGTGANSLYGVRVLEDNGDYYIDGVQLEQKASATTYIDTSRTVSNLQYATSANINAGTGSISVWIKPSAAINATPTDQYLFDIRSDASNRIALYMDASEDDLTLNTNGTETSSVGITMTADTWQHLVLTYDFTTDQYKVYKNGVETPIISTTTALTAPTLPANFNLGADYANAGNFNGTISDLRASSSVYTSAEITDLFDAGLISHMETAQTVQVDRFDTEKGQGPVAVWHMNEGQGTATNDSSSYLNHLTVSGATWTRNANQTYLKFDGGNDSASRTFDQDFDFGTGNFTLTGMFKHPNTVTGTDTILARQSGSVGYKVYMNDSGYICFSVNTDSICTSVSYADSRWHYFNAVRDAAALTLYLDTILSGTTAQVSPATVDGNNTMYLGIDADGTSNPWDGYLDEVMVYSVARDTTQIKTDNLGGQIETILGGRVSDNLTEGLLGWWKMNESSGDAADSSGNSNTLTNINTTAYTTGKFANAMTTTLNTKYLSTTTAMSGVKTVSFWIYPNATTTYPLDLNGTQTVTATSGTISAGNFTGATIYVNGVASNTLTASMWQHVTIATNTGFNTGNMTIGLVGSNSLNGNLDEVRLYNRVLSPMEVIQLYEWAPQPVAYWNLDEGTGQSIQDISGNGYTGTLGANTNSSTDDPAWANGKYGRGLDFDGTSDYVNVPYSAGYDLTANQTISFWWKPVVTWTNGSTGYKSILSRSSTASDTDNDWLFFLNQDDAGRLRFGTYGGNIQTGTATWTAGTWYHISVAFTSSTAATIYVNGVVDNYNSDYNPGAIDGAQDNPIMLARGYNADIPGDSYLAVSLDDIKIYNYVRTQKQIAAGMNASHPSVSPSLGSPMVYYKFDEGYGAIANNSGNGGPSLNGSISGATWSNSGKSGKALDFGDNEVTEYYVSQSTLLDTMPSALSISMWVNPISTIGNSLAYSAYLFSKTNLFGQDRLLCSFVPNDGRLSCGTEAANGGVKNLFSTTSTWTAGTWYHILFTWDTDHGKRLYVNGKLENSDTTATTLMLNGSYADGFIGK